MSEPEWDDEEVAAALERERVAALGRGAKYLVALATITVASCTVLEPITRGQLQLENANENSAIETYWRERGEAVWRIGPQLKSGEVGDVIFVNPGFYEIKARYIVTDFTVTIHDQEIVARMIKIVRFN